MEPGTEQEIREGTQKVVSAVAGQAKERTKTALGAITQESNALAGALRSAAEQAERDGARMVHGPLRKLADFCEQLGGRVGHQTPQQLFSGLSDFGRREPLMLFGTAAAIGFFGTRALRAGAQVLANDAQREGEDETETAERTS